MKKILLISTYLLLMMSCSFKAQDQKSSASSPNAVTREQNAATIKDPNIDTDGDSIKDSDEIQRGSNPFIANIPDLRIRFLQNYKIIVAYTNKGEKSKGTFEIDTKVHENDPNFKYRVGESFIRNESFQSAAKVGKFSTHTTGEIGQHDLSWVSYPDIDPKFYSKKQLEFQSILNANKFQIDSITITLENSARLIPNDFFKEINNLSLNFYYYDYEKENYELIKTALVEKHFNAGVNETFEVVLENVPLKLLSENYFKRGEFIISEIGDYNISDLGSTYKTLLTSVKAKCVPVIFNTPLESSISYVSTGEQGQSFVSILTTLFDTKFKVENNELEKIGQFENNLPDYTYLKEIKDLDKKGKWFILTNKINQHYLDYKFTPSDTISLSYVVGSELAAQTSEKVVSLRENAISDNGYKIYPLGNISPNSSVDIEIKPISLYGTAKKNWQDHPYNSGGSCGRNCVPREFYCNMDFNLFEPFTSALSFDLEKQSELDRMSLIVNNDEFSLKDLIAKKKVIATLEQGNLHFVIKDISSIKAIQEVDENVLALKLIEFKETTFNGVKLVSWSGRDWYTCQEIAMNMAGQNKWPLSVDSNDFSNWQKWVNWSLVQRGDPKTYTHNFSVGISAIINNFYN